MAIGLINNSNQTEKRVQFNFQGSFDGKFNWNFDGKFKWELWQEV